LDGNPVADGSTVAALVDGEQIGDAAADGGSYAIEIVYNPAHEGMEVSFQVYGNDAGETATYASGSLDLDLTAASPPVSFQGSVTLDGVAAADGVTVVASMASAEAAPAEEAMAGDEAMTGDEAMAGRSSRLPWKAAITPST
jgi:hypothetical protein